jgi:hypothetical protein
MIYLLNYTEYYLEHWLNFAEFLLHVGVFAQDLTFFHGICKIVFALFTLHRDACNKICKMLSVVHFMYGETSQTLQSHLLNVYVI